MRSMEGKKAVVNQGLGGRESVPAMVRGGTTGTIAVRNTGASFLVQNRFILKVPKWEVASLAAYISTEKPMWIFSLRNLVEMSNESESEQH